MAVGSGDDALRLSLSNPILLKAKYDHWDPCRNTGLLIANRIVSSTAHLLYSRGFDKIPTWFYQQKNEAIIAIKDDLAIADRMPSDALVTAIGSMAISEVRRADIHH